MAFLIAPDFPVGSTAGNRIPKSRDNLTYDLGLARKSNLPDIPRSLRCATGENKSPYFTQCRPESFSRLCERV